jgi:tetratricopeptide (TPR) repeat protein
MVGSGGAAGGNAPVLKAPAPPPPAQATRGAAHAAHAGDVTKDEGRRAHDAKQEPDPLSAANGASATGVPPPPVVHRPMGACSDAASRPLAERIVLWKRRLARVTEAMDLVAQYDMAHAACELPDWRDEAALLDLVQEKIETEQAAELFLGYLASEPDAQRYVARAILRRTVDARLEAAVARVLFGAKIDWAKVDRELLDIDKADDREAHLRAAMLVAPGDPEGDVRLVRLLAQNGKRDEALAYGRRLRDRGLVTPALAQQLGDVLADAGDADEALRTYSEIVEFDPGDAKSRRLLGDVFLRQGWYAAAYRQYKTLTDLDSKTAASWLRLAAAAAGAGRVDEAFRIEHDVASGEGSPGPDDPRYWARLWSAARLGALLADPAKAGGDGAADGISRRLKQLQLFSGPGTLALLTWEDLDARLALGNADDKKDVTVGEPTDAGPTGLYAVFAQTDAWQRNAWAVRWRADAHGRSVKYSLVTLAWDGKAFTVAVRNGQLSAATAKAAL